MKSGGGTLRKNESCTVKSTDIRTQGQSDDETQKWMTHLESFDTNEMLDIVKRKREMSNEEKSTTGNRKKVSTVGKTMISFLGLFNPNMREVVEMLYLTEEPVVLSGEKYERLIGPVPKTSCLLCKKKVEIFVPNLNDIML